MLGIRGPHSVNNRGDTLIEVLLSIGILGFVMTGAYGVASASLRQGIRASEHTHADKIMEGQIESLKFRERYYQSKPHDFYTLFASTTQKNYCLDTASTGPGDRWLPYINGGSWPNITYNGNCVFDQGKYSVNIALPPVWTGDEHDATTNPPTYQITVQWNGVDGQTETVKVFYRF